MESKLNTMARRAMATDLSRHACAWNFKCPRQAVGMTGRPALSLIEVVASTMIVGLMAVAALNSLGAATRSAESIGNRAVALALADELMAEIVQLPYEDPTQSVVFGLETGEAATPRSGFDDVDDYADWNQSPPQYRDGTVIPDRSQWRHRVQVRFVTPSDPSQASVTEQGAKLILVVIDYDGVTLAEQIAIRTNVE
jgi:type II secretory pathway pseudopilin PulG